MEGDGSVGGGHKVSHTHTDTKTHADSLKGHPTHMAL